MVFDDGGRELSCPGRKGRGRTCDSTQRDAGWSASWGTWALALPLWDSSAHHCTTNDVGHFPLTQRVVGLAGVHPSCLGKGGLHPPDTSAVYCRARKTKNHRHSHSLLQTCLGLTCLAGISFDCGWKLEHQERTNTDPGTTCKPTTVLLWGDSSKHCTVSKAQTAFVCDRLTCEQQRAHTVIFEKFCSNFPNI